MPVPAEKQDQRDYVARTWTLVRTSASELVAAPSASNRLEAAHRLQRQLLWLTIIGTIVIVGLMFGVDAAEIGLMPKRGDPSLWPARVLTDFGKDAYVLWCLASALIALSCEMMRLCSSARIAFRPLFILSASAMSSGDSRFFSTSATMLSLISLVRSSVRNLESRAS